MSKNNKGFTLVELITSFSLTIVIIIMLFKMVISLKDIYQTSGIKTELLNKQYILTDKIYSDFYDLGLKSISSCGDNCLTFSFNDSTSKNLSINNSKLTYDDYVINLLNSSYIGNFSVESVNVGSSGDNDSVLNIKLSIYDKLIKDTDFGINIVYQYNSSNVTVQNISFNNNEVSLSGNLLESLKQVGISGEGELYKIEEPATEQTSATTEYRFKGKDPNNYITFNNELWRIIGIVDGKVKIIRNESIGNYAFDNTEIALKNSDYNTLKTDNLLEEIIATPMAPSGCYTKGKSDYSTSPIKNYLNGDYYNGLDSNSKNYISSSTWYLAATENVDHLAKDMYKLERGNTVITGHNTNWNGFVGIMYPSDYGYASNCSASKVLDSYNSEECKNSNWLYKGVDEWTITPSNWYNTSNLVFHIESSGELTNIYGTCESNAELEFAIRPVIYLNETVNIKSGTGEKTNPLTIISRQHSGGTTN